MSVTPAGHDFRVGAVLRRSWRIFAGGLLFFLGVPALIDAAVVATGGATVLLLEHAGGDPHFGPTAATVGGFLIIILAVPLNLLGQAVLLVGAFQRLRGEPIRASAALKRALARFLPLVGLVLLVGLGLAVVGLVCSVVLSAFVTLLGFIGILLVPLFVAPVVVLLVMWAVIVPACVVEGLGPIESLVRSADLTRGHRWKVLGLILLLVIAYVFASELTDAILRPTSSDLAALAGFALIAAWTAYWNCAAGLLYHDLRVAKEGVDTREIAAVFA
ncbi:MAG TPA: hypothetical protein VLX44_11650 [Xanthobacteraceae bacterium]|nr:hypothetical protein [Xanthobacteraceae bacterium]